MTCLQGTQLRPVALKKKILKDVNNENDLIMKLAVLFVSHLIASDISRVDNEDVQL